MPGEWIFKRISEKLVHSEPTVVTKGPWNYEHRYHSWPLNTVQMVRNLLKLSQ